MFTRRQDSAEGRAGEAGGGLLIPRESRGLRRVAYSVALFCQSVNQVGCVPGSWVFLLLKHFMLLRLEKLN